MKNYPKKLDNTEKNIDLGNQANKTWIDLKNKETMKRHDWKEKLKDGSRN